MAQHESKQQRRVQPTARRLHGHCHCLFLYPGFVCQVVPAPPFFFNASDIVGRSNTSKLCFKLQRDDGMELHGLYFMTSSPPGRDHAQSTAEIQVQLGVQIKSQVL